MQSADKILKADDYPQVEIVKTPEWGENVYIRVMNGLERDRWELNVGRSIEKGAT